MNAAAPAPAPLPVPAQPSRGIVETLLRDPNAIWMREMRQAARIGRTPWILFSITLTISLLMCSIGGIAAASGASPAVIGSILFQVFFSLAFFVVVIAGPAIAANGIASEREGKTWEAVLLTGLSPKTIARGKFLAAYTTIALYIVVLAPVGALSFLFGGITATEVVIAFAYLFLLAALSIAFGLAVSSLMSSMRLAIVLTLILAITVGTSIYSMAGFGLSFAAHELWKEVPDFYPVWLPLAYTRAPFGLEYVVFLIVVPLLNVLIPAWFLYEVTIANLTSEGEDKSTGLKRWFTIVTPLFAGCCVAPCLVATDADACAALNVIGNVLFTTHMCFGAFLFASEPPAPSRRVRIHWHRSGVGALRRFFGPSLAKTGILLVFLGFFGIFGIAGIGIANVAARFGTVGTSADELRIFFYALYMAPFFVFTVGLVAWLRARQNAPWIARILAAALLLLAAVGPWVVEAIGGVLERGGGGWYILIGAPSPFFLKYMFDWADGTHGANPPVIEVGAACALFWGILGLVLYSLAARRGHKLMVQHDRAVAQAEAALRAEDDQQAAEAQRQMEQTTPGAPPPEVPSEAPTQPQLP